MPSSASSIRSRRAWLPTDSSPVLGVGGVKEKEAFWEQRGGTEAWLSVAGGPRPADGKEESGWTPALYGV